MVLDSHQTWINFTCKLVKLKGKKVKMANTEITNDLNASSVTSNFSVAPYIINT